jgi:aminoglycoside phosphotransferase (APT) family kinase protein
LRDKTPVPTDKADEKAWRELGRLMGHLHTIQLEKSGPLDNRRQAAEERLLGVIGDIEKKSPVPLTHSFNAARLANGNMSLVHGDVHGRNVIAKEDGNLAVLDWDNAVIDYPELDLVKPKHWTAADKNGFFVPHQKFYDAYLQGHTETFGAAPDPERMRLYELSWLIRVYRFEEMREASGRTPAPPAPPAKSYLPRIRELAGG